jgi:hypothetical protein
VIAGRLRRTALLFQVVRGLGLEHSFCKRFLELPEQTGIGEHGLQVVRLYAFEQFVECGFVDGHTYPFRG